FLEDYYTLCVVARDGIGTNHLDGNTRLCTATAGQSLKETFGSDGQPGSFKDMDTATRSCTSGRRVDARARPAERPESPAPRRDRPAADACGEGGRRPPSDPRRHERRRPERDPARADRERLGRPRVDPRPHGRLRRARGENGVASWDRLVDSVHRTGAAANGLILLRDLQALLLAAEAISITWVMAGQAAQAARDA